MSAQRSVKRHNPYRRAIAQAIELERTHDVLARIIGHSIPLPDRIVPEGNRKGDALPERMRLPRHMTLEAMNDIAESSFNAIQEIGEEIIPTLGNVAGIVDDLLDDAQERVIVEQGYRGTRKGPSRIMDPEDRMTFEKRTIRDILRAADAPPPTISLAKAPRAAPVEQESLAIDLMMEGLLDYYRVDRQALYAELMEFRQRMANRQSSIELVSPGARANRAEPIKSLGRNFPDAHFNLRGLSLDVISISIPGERDDISGMSWTYHGAGTRHDKFKLSCQDGLHAHDVFDFPQRALRDVTGDRRFHDALVIDMVDRYGMTIVGDKPVTKITLRPGYAHLDPPTINPAMRTPIRRPSDVRSGAPGRSAEHPDTAIIRLVDRLLRERGHNEHRRINRIEGQGIVVQLSDRGTENLLHRYVIQRDTIDDGIMAITARVDDIVTKLAKWYAKHGRTRYLPRAMNADATPASVTTPEADATPKDNVTNPGKAIGMLGDEAKTQWEACQRIDALLLDILGKKKLDADGIELHHQEGMLLVKTMVVAKGVVYRLERYDRVLGKVTHAIGTLDIDRVLAPATVESLRDGNISRLVPDLGGFGKSQVRKVSVRDGSTSITVRVPLSPRPE